LNQVAHLEAIDLARKNIDKWYRQISSELDHKRQQRKQLVQEIKTYDYLPRLEAEVEVLEQTEQKVGSIRKTASALQQVIDRLEDIRKRAEHYKKITVVEPQVDHALELSKERQGLSTKIDNLASLLRRLDRLAVEKARLAQVVEAEQLVDNVLQLLMAKEDLDSKYRDLDNRVSKIKHLQSRLSTLEQREKELEKRFYELMPDVCPLCGQEVKHEEN